MRPIGHIQDQMQAKRFGGFLYHEGVENQIDPDSQGRWEIWILDDANIERAKSLLEQFGKRPDDPRFVKASRAAEEKAREDQQAQTGKRTRVIDGRTIFYTPPVPLGILSISLIVISIAVTLLADFGKKDGVVQPLSITRYKDDGQYIRWDPGLPEVRRGQIWRLFTPMFLHFHILHIFFNMLWLRDLGSMVEARKSSWMLLLLVLILAATSNVGQYVVHGPNFGGMSGVVYGLFGYIWMQSRFHPASKLSLQPQTVTLMIVWFVVCLAGLVGNVANVAHGVGLGVGIAWGFLAARPATRSRRH
ncbi:MAG: hypothetical protein A2Y76_05500 [Planctomycetes bacterium RBG_13_60_9]|nr:MAG: hypothetical protein A2Y76_05500 [Planctomycetes bacterium RBG_13_60_9]